MSKIKLTEDCLDLGFVKLYRIEALVDIPERNVKKGDKGGYVEKVTQVYGNAWVSGNAWVYGNARVSGNAWVYGNAQVSGDAWVYGNARVSGNAWVSGDAQVYGNAQVYGDAWVYGNAQVYGDAWVYGNARVYGDAWVSGDAVIDSISAIIVIVIAMKYSITVTRKHLFIGCKIIKRSELKYITPDKAKEMGLPRELFDGYKAMIRGAMKLVKRKM